MFGALDAASSGVSLGRTWIDATSDNVANVNTVRPAGEEPFRARLVVAQSRTGTGGVDVAAIRGKPGEPQVTFDPDNPLADEEGYVTQPHVDLTEEMTNMMMASRLYQANISVMQQARETYSAALRIGTGS
ncbi:MAG: flagellar basal-body rod protein FlgC [Frankiales bacterium]|jgi:flagellar basal-body rod protein FlgC|nr:flagellar basal-body rod protein FlgC [Frankiales bacterium]